jgi:hypothetical protein
MAGRVNIYKVIRKIHLIASMIMFSFLLMYVITGIILINRSLFNIPEVTVSRDKILVENGMIKDEAREFARYLKEELNLKGRVSYNKDWQENWLFHYNFPGDNYRLTLRPENDTIYIKRSQQERTLFTVTQQMHVMRGYKGGWAYTVWAVMYDVSCLAMLVFAISGILIWFRIRKSYKYGWWFLASGIIIPAVIIFMFLFWR